SFLPLQDDRIRYSGQPIALVIASTLEQASEAARHVSVDYEILPPVSDIDDPAAKAIEIPGAAAADSQRGDARGALATAAVRVEAIYTTPREYNCPMEPLATIASWDQAGNLTVRQPSQW